MIIACPYCAAVQELPSLPPRTVARCRRCEGILEQTAGRSITAAFALSLATFLMLIPAYALPFLSFSKLGFSAETRLGSGVVTLFQQRELLLAFGVLLFGILLPLTRFGLLSASLGAVRFGHRPYWLPQAFRWATALDLWAMPDVFLLACIVGYNRLGPYLPLHIHAGGYCFLAAALLSMITHASLDRRTVWRAIPVERPQVSPGGPHLCCLTCDLLLPMELDGRRCSRCRSRVHARKPDAMIRTAALVIAGYLFYLPANVFPMSTMVWFGGREGHTVFWGIMKLVQASLLPLAALIFFTSIMLPVLKLLGMTWCLLSVRRRSRRHLVTKTKVYRLLDDMGRWSNMDPFTVSIFAPLVQFQPIVSIHASVGSTFFFSVVTLSMLASHWFDPRLMWDAAGQTQEVPPGREAEAGGALHSTA